MLNPVPEPDERYRYAQARLVAELKSKGISDDRVLTAMGLVPRHRFVDSSFANLAYADQALPIGCEQTISQPYIVALMTELLIGGDVPEVVLEVGTGSGYQSAVLSRIVPRVFTIERIGSLYKAARALFVELGCNNVHSRCADGRKGWVQFAPFDGVIVTAASSGWPPALLRQLRVGGRAIAPIGNGRQSLVLLRRDKSGYSEEPHIDVKFVPLLGR